MSGLAFIASFEVRLTASAEAAAVRRSFTRRRKADTTDSWEVRLKESVNKLAPGYSTKNPAFHSLKVASGFSRTFVGSKVRQ